MTLDDKEQLEEYIIKKFTELERGLEDLHDVVIAYGRFDEPTISWEEMKRNILSKDKK